MPMAGNNSKSVPSAGDRILFASPSWIGDILMALPAFIYLRRKHPAAELLVLAKPGPRQIWELFGLADRILEQEPGLAGSFRTAARLKSLGCRRAYIVPNSFRSALIAFLARIPERIGFRGHWRRLLLSSIAERRRGEERCHQTCEILDLVAAPAELMPRMPPLTLDADMVSEVCERLDFTPESIGLVPGAARGPSKCWPEEHYISLGRILAEAGFTLAVFGAANERELCERVAARIGDSACSYAGRTTVAEWAALISACQAVVANDSGGMHLAAALGVPLVAIYGITDPAKTGPLGDRCRVLQKSEIRARRVPRESHLARKCLESITPESVYSALCNMVAVTRNGDPESFDEH